MKSMKSYLNLAIASAIAVFSTAACSTPVDGLSAPNVNKILSEAGLLKKYWHKEISDGGKDSHSQSWIVSAYGRPEEKEGQICVAVGNTWVLNEENEMPDRIEIKSSEKVSLMHILGAPFQKCETITPEEYFLVEPTIPYADVLALIDDIEISLPCIQANSQCKGWSQIDIKSEPTRSQLSDFKNMVPFALESIDDETLELTYRYDHMSSDKNYLLFTVSRRPDGLRNLRVSLRPFEAE